MRITKYRKTLKGSYIRAHLLCLFAVLLFMKGYVRFTYEGENLFHMTVNGQEIGAVSSPERARELLWEARAQVASQSPELVFLRADLEVRGEEILWGSAEDEEQVRERLIQVLEDSVLETARRCYTLKVNEYIVNLGDLEEVRRLLEAAVGRYDASGSFGIGFSSNGERKLHVLTADVCSRQDGGESSHVPEGGQLWNEAGMFKAGISARLEELFGAAGEQEPQEFEDYQLGILDMSFPQEVEVAECYLPSGQLTSLEQAVQELTVEQEQQQIYTVESGDTLSEIAIKVNIPMDRIVEMNEGLEDENTVIRVGQELIITVPEPELSVERHEVNYYEEIYDAPVVYIDNDGWYTTDTVVRQQPSAGFRRIIALETFVNDTQTDREILKEEVVMEAVAKVVERGTKIPPTYIKPISGGRLTSRFGSRTAPTKGASTNHKGVDWATPVGTTVVASCGGRVSKAGWGSGYGYVVYIDHEDGRQTRYGHLSKVLVKVGDYVKQGQRIALSGNTGVSTGPHVHFEILIGGKQVNPLNYLN